MFKRFILLSCALLLIVCFYGCKRSSAANKAAEQAPVEQTIEEETTIEQTDSSDTTKEQAPVEDTTSEVEPME